MIIYFITLQANSQIIRGSAGIDIYKNIAFEKSGFASVNIGLEFKISHYIKPELNLRYFLGTLPDSNVFNTDGTFKENLIRTVSAKNISFCPKFILNDFEAPIRFQVIPSYDITQIIAKADLFKINNANTGVSKIDSDEFKETIHSFGMGIGIVFDLDEDSSQSLALTLYYNNIEIGNAISNLKFDTTKYNTNQNIGVGVKYYFSFRKKNNSKL